MKRRHLYVITFIVILGALWLVVRWTGMFQFYKIPTTANEPGYSPGDWIYVSNLSEPNLLDFVVFENENGEVFTFRLCGKSGDLIELRNGVLHVNGKNKDAKLTLNFIYQLNESDYNKLPAFDYPYETLRVDSDTFLVLMNNKDSKHFPSAAPYEPPGRLHTDFPYGSRLLNFGPIKVPKGKVFVLGDFRNNARDSRYIGFINEDQIQGKVLN